MTPALPPTPDEAHVVSLINHLAEALEDLKKVSDTHPKGYLHTVEFILQEIQYVSKQKGLK